MSCSRSGQMKTQLYLFMFWDFSSMKFCSLLSIYVNIYHSQRLDNALTTIFPQFHLSNHVFQFWDGLSQILSGALLLWTRWTHVTAGDQIRDTGSIAHRIYLAFLNPSWNDGRSLIKLLKNRPINWNDKCITGLMKMFHRNNL